MNHLKKHIGTVCLALLSTTAVIIFSTPTQCFGQIARETWQPPEKILDAIGVKPGMRVGEAGAGQGYFTFPLARRVGSEGIVFANDISTSSLDVIRERAVKEGLGNIKIVMGEVEDPLFPEKNLDMVVMVYVLHMLERPIHFLKNLHSYLKPGGLLVIIERNTTVERAHSPSFMTNSQILETVGKTGYELDRTENFLPRDKIYIYKMLTTSGLHTGDIHEAVNAGDLNKVQALIKADPTLLEAKDENDNTPLITACLAKQVTIANFFLDQGADVNAKGRFQFTPLTWASDVRDQDTTLLQRLIDKGADVNSQGVHGTTPLHRAAYRGGLKVAKLLLDHGANVNVLGYNGVTPLHRAAQSGDIQVAKLLIDRGADINAYDKYSGPIGPEDINGTVLQVAINLSPNEETANVLVENGAKLAKKDFNGNTELHLAALKGYAGLVRLLVEHGADVNAVNQYNRTALYYAAKHGYRSVANVLISAGANKSSIVETNYGKAPQLIETLKDGEAYLWNLDGYNYVVKTKENLLAFIYSKDKIKESPEAGLANGCLNPIELVGQKITVFTNHRDNWHMGAGDFGVLAKLVPDINVVSSFKPDFSNEKNFTIPSYRLAAANESFSIAGILVHTIPALGGGVGYLVEADGVKIFNAGLHVSDNEAENVAKFRKEIDFLKPFGPIDIVILSVFGHNNRVGTDFEPFLYLLDKLLPKAIYLGAANNPEQYPKCAAVLRPSNIPVVYPEVRAGERYHYLRKIIQK